MKSSASLKEKKIRDSLADPLLFTLYRDFFSVHLTTLTNKSPNTISAYRESMLALLDFVKAQKKCDLNEITFEMIDHKMLEKFLDHLETDRGCAISTRNHRLQRIRAFYKYAAKMEPAAVVHYNEIKKVPRKNLTKQDIIEYMSEDAVKAILAQPDVMTMKGLRDQFFMILLYDTGARIDEMVKICMTDIRLSKTPTVTLHGKRGKIRTVPIMAITVEHFKSYAEIFHPGINQYSDAPLFYTTWDNGRHKMHPDTARQFVEGYAESAHEMCPDVPLNIHPHLWRHTRAMHLYQHGMDLTLISQWLGHVNLDTTRIYAKADTEQKRKAIEKAGANSGPLSQKLNAKRFTVSDEETLKRLYGLID